MAGSRYVPITLAQMDDLLVTRCGFTRYTRSGTMEYLYERKVVFKDGTSLPMKVRVYSSVHLSDGVTREVGEDAIRVQLVNAAVPADKFPDGLPIKKSEFKQAKKTIYRTQNALTNLYDACRNMFVVADAISCPKCGAALKKRKSRDNNEFYGCSMFPTCNGTRRLEEVVVPAF
jgi:hypothetical protein